MWKKKSPEMKILGQRLSGVYGAGGGRKRVDSALSYEEAMAARDEAWQLKKDIRARSEGARAAGTKFYCLSCKNGYDQPAGRGCCQTCPNCQAEHCNP